MFDLAIVNKRVITVTLGWHDSIGVTTVLFLSRVQLDLDYLPLHENPDFAACEQ